MTEAPILTTVVRRDRWIVAVALALVCALAWAWLAGQTREMAAAPAAMGGMGAMPTTGPVSYTHLTLPTTERV